MQFSDSMSLSFGDHSTTGDYQLNYVNGSDFNILGMSGGSGDLVLGTYASGTTTKNLVSKRSDNSVELYYNNSKKANTYTAGLQITGTLSVGTGNIVGHDNSKLKLGTSDDLQMFHDGTNSRIYNTTGQLQIRSDVIALENNDGSNYASITGLRLLDNAKARFGSSNDLEIYHDGTETFIHNNTDDLNIEGDSIKLRSHSGEAYVICTADDKVELRYDNSKKLETTSAGVTVTGSLTATGNITAYSDERLKENVQTINDALGICGKLRGVSYTWKKEQYKDVGLIAQEVEKVLPEVVWPVESGIKTVDYGRIVGVLVQAINELKAEVDQLKGGK